MALKERKPYNHLPVITSCGGPLGMLARLLNIVQNCSTLQHFVTHCDTLHCRALQLTLDIMKSCSKLPHPATRRNTLHCPALQRTAPRCTTLHYAAPHYATLHRTAKYCNKLLRMVLVVWAGMLNSIEDCNTLQHTATHFIITLKHTATQCNSLHCNTLQHTFTNGAGYLGSISYIFQNCRTLHHTHHTATHCTTGDVYTTTHCNKLQHVALQHIATHCATFNHTATHCCGWCWVCRLVQGGEVL